MDRVVVGVGVLGVGSYLLADLAGRLPNQISFFDAVSRRFINLIESVGSQLAAKYEILPQNFTTNSTPTFNAKTVGQWASRIGQEFINGTGYEQGALGALVGSILLRESQNFTDSVGLDPAKASERVGHIAVDVIAHLPAGEIAEKINEQLQSVLESLDVPALLQHLIDDLEKVATTTLRDVGGQLIKVATLELLPIILLGLAATIATPLATYWVYRRALHNIGAPKLATEVHQHTLITPLTERVKDAASSLFGSSRMQKKPVFSPKITRRVDELIAAIQNIRKNGGYFQHVLFYGPGGTGKTLISEYIAKNTGMSYIKMSGGDLAQYIKRGEHVTELNKLFDKLNLSWRPWSTRQWILYIDEAESLCRDRATIPTAELLELQNAFLNRTGTESTKFMIILSTNQVGYLDEAVLTRIDHKIYIGPPAEPERVRILQSYIPQFFSTIEQERYFKLPQVQRIAKATNGFPGRSLFKLLNAISNKKASSVNHILTQTMIDQSVIDMVSAEREIEKRRAIKEAPPIKRPLLKPPTPPFPKHRQSARQIPSASECGIGEIDRN
jgi:DNA polymerase III delta prime subunit